MNSTGRPVLVFWETTKACPLACRHCRASSITSRDPKELTSREAEGLIGQVREFGEGTILVFTGGDPLMRDDIFQLISRASQSGLRPAISPAPTSKVTLETAVKLKEAGVVSASISIDGVGETHDWIRRYPGNFSVAVDAIERLQEASINVQVNTLLWKRSVRELPKIVKLLRDLNVKIWEVFLLVETGRAVRDLLPSRDEIEAVMYYLVYVMSYGIHVRTVEAPFFRRVLLEGKVGIDSPSEVYENLINETREYLGEGVDRERKIGRVTRDGDGVIFISSEGEVYPSGFLPLALGNVRRDRLIDIYKQDSLLRKIRESSFSGKCGTCKFREVCGGSRARAFSISGDPLGEDPLCPYS